MGQDMGVVAMVDSLAVLRQQSIWRQNPADLGRPSRPDVFKLAGEHATYLSVFFFLLSVIPPLPPPPKTAALGPGYSAIDRQATSKARGSTGS